MIGLGNGRRGMKSPPLLVAALVACIIVLGFNYWIASCRSIDLQNRIMELEGRVRRAAAERGAVELKKNEFQGELQKQREQIDKIQNLHNFQMESTNKIHRDEKAMLMNNITINKKLIQNFQDHLKELQKEYGKLQLDVYQFQKNQTNLQKKFTYDMSQCISQMKELKEQCEERIEEIMRKGNEIPQSKGKKDMSDKSYQIDIPVPTFGQLEFQQRDLTKQGNEPEEKQKISKISEALEAPKPTPFIKNVAEPDYHKYRGNNDVVAINKEEPPNEEEKYPVDEDHPILAKSSKDHKELHPELGTEQNPYEDIRNALGEVVERQNVKWPGPLGHRNTNQANDDDDEVEREQLLNDDLQQDDQEMSELGTKTARQVNKGVDYNSDKNEAETETDKQPALVDHQRNLNVI
ncbi:Golgi membrane protein 1 isoform X1 [Sphaerodactylus townsendi]|uniref:Golgi membrane protein 1 isoform X1 n=1 Tax=Sphaerodactylus townsendi TaxID=933632 RepID=UPI002026D7B7|nr:Golgi membrane protein 1 isoform X1 [Sphaerodactylus townsendi]